LNNIDITLPGVSVLMTVYNTKGKWLTEAIDSILQQTYKNFELVIVNDGSINEETNQTLNDYVEQNSIINLITFEKNQGRVKALNEGLKNCQNDLIFIFDSDDIAFENAIDSQIKYFLDLEKNTNNKIGSLGCRLRWMDAFSYEKLGFSLNNKPCISQSDFLFFNDNKIIPLINNPCAVYRKSLILSDKIKGYSNENPEDFFLWMKLIENGYNLYNNPECLFLYRCHNRDSLSNTIKDEHKQKMIEKCKFISEKFKNFSDFNKLFSNTTIVTACFYLKDYYPENSQIFSRTVHEMVNENGEFLLNKLCYMTIFCDEYTYPEIFKIRNEKYNLDKFTKYHVMKFEDIWSYQWKDKVIENREKYWPTRDNRAEWPSHLLNCNKADFILTAINENTFKNSKFLWCDFNIKKIFNDPRVKNYYDQKYSILQRDTLFLNILNNIPDKFHVHIINVVNKQYLSKNLKEEYYNRYRYKIAGGLFSMTNHIDHIEILNDLKQNFIDMTELGYGHGDELLFYDIYYKYFDKFERSYGDYSELIYNFCYPTENLSYILNNVVKNYLNLRYYEECFETCEKCLYGFYNKKVEMNWNIFLNFLFYKYVSAFYCNKEASIKTAHEILYYVDNIHDFKIEFDKSREFYLQQLSFVL
jgi:glycosyltransferase involved in cell wall biosynthesis